MPDQSLYLAEPKLTLSSGRATPELMKDLLQITVEESLHLPAMFTLVVQNSYIPTVERSEYKPWRYEKLFEIGGKVKIGFISSTTQDSDFKKKLDDYLIEGEITAMEVHFNEKSEAHMIIRGYDISHRLHRGRYNRSFLNKTDSDIVKDIAGEVGIGIGTIDPSGEAYDYVFQENQTNMEFLRERAARIGFELFIQEEKIYFRKPVSQASLTLKWLVDISKFSTRVTSAEQVSSVEVRGWDYIKKTPIVEIANKENVITKTGNNQGSKTSSAFNGKPSDPKMTVVDQPVVSREQAKQMAQALCDELGGEFVYADAKAWGNPQIRPGKIISLTGMGDRYSGKYYVTETRHFYSQRVYTTNFSVRGLRAGNLFTTISTQTRLQPGQTFLVGIVTDNKDPKGLSRVKVKFPTLTDKHTSNWARVVAIGAGQNRGFDCLPEINDEVLVGFEHGDIHRPYVIGGVWNGKDAPPEKVDDSVDKGVRLRTIKTRTGHTLQFIEEDKGSSKTGIRVETTKGHKIYCNDSDQFIEITTNGGHKIKMDDRGQAISIETTGGHSIEMNDMSKSISVESTGNMSLKANMNITVTANLNIDIKATGIITINGTMINLN